MNSPAHSSSMVPLALIPLYPRPPQIRLISVEANIPVLVNGHLDSWNAYLTVNGRVPALKLGLYHSLKSYW
jgi:hypothetical protein